MSEGEGDDDLLTVAEAAKLVGRSYGTVEQWAKRGRMAPAGTRTVRYRTVNVYRRADVLRLHEAPSRRRASDGKSTDEMTAEELDAFVAERLKPENLPKWWRSESRVAKVEVAKVLKGIVKSRTRGRKKS